jgi:hypothetical protein
MKSERTITQLQEADSPHIWTLTEAGGTQESVFRIRKPQGNQTIIVPVPETVPVASIVKAWDAAGKRWVQKYLKKDAEPFEALRVVEVNDLCRYVWYLCHAKTSSPADSLKPHFNVLWSLEEIAEYYGFGPEDIYTGK